MKSLQIVLISALIWFLVPPPSLGQDVPPSTGANGQDAAGTGTAQPNGGDAAQPKIEPIPPADIAAQAAETDMRLDRLKDQIQPSPAVAELALEIANQAETIAKLQSRLDELTAATVSNRQLEDQRGQWRRLQDRLDGWMSRADARWKEVQATRAELKEIQTRWQLTRDAETSEELPVELTNHIDEILARIESLLQQTQQRIDQLAAILEQLSGAKTTATTALDRLSAFAENVTQRLMMRDAPPLWQTHTADWLGLDDTTQKASQTWLRDFWAFAREYWIRLLAHALLLVGLTIAAFAARRASRHWPEDEEELDRARFLVSRPFSVALIFAVLAGAFIYASVPAVGRDFFHLLILIPIVRLAPGLTTTTERIGLYGLLGVLGLHVLAQLCPEGSLLLRVMLLAAEVAAGSLMTYLLWRGRWRSGQPLTWRRGISLAACAVLLMLFVAALFANVLGWVNLAHFLTESTILTSESALLAVLFVRAGSGLLPAITRYGPGRALLSVRRHTERFEQVGRALLVLLLLSLWFRQALRRFRLREPLLEQAEQLWTARLSWTGVEITTGDVVQALLIVVAAILAQRLVRFFMQEEIFPRLRVPASSAAIFTTLTNYAVIGMGLLMAGSALGFTATQLTVLFGALGVGIGFGLQNIVNNFLSGLILIFEQPIKVGDILESGGTWGTVKRIGVRATVLRTFDGAEIIVPNGDLLSKEIKNWTLSDAVSRVEVLVGVAYGSNPSEVLEILRRVATANPLVLREPAPLPLMVGFGDSSLDFKLLCWVKIDDRFQGVSQLHVAVEQALADADITIPFPQRDLHVRSVEASTAELANLVEGKH